MSSLLFLYPWVIYVGIPLICIVSWIRFRPYKKVLYTYPLATQVHHQGLTTRVPRNSVLLFLRTFILMVLVMLLAKPQLVDPRSCVEVEGIDIVLALDVSGSMSCPGARDDRRRRIDIAKEEAVRFINKRTHDALGLVIFGDDAISRCPLTTDKRTLLDIISGIDIGMVRQEGTVITKALLTAINRLRYSKATSKIIILLTDGEPTPNDLDPRIAIKAAQELQVKIYTIGIGDNEDIVVQHPIYGLVPVANRVNTKLLTLLAQETGGTFFMAKQSDDMRRIYDTINALEKTRIEMPLFTRQYDWFIPLVWLALALIMVEVYLLSFIWFGL